MVLHNPNNWHWVNKDVLDWTKAYFEKHLPGISASDGNVSAKIDSVLSVDGDAEVSQRKGKVITIFDVSLSLEYSGLVEGGDDGGEDASGTIKIPELMHDTEPEELQFEISLYTESPEKTLVRELVRTKLVPQLREHLVKVGPAMIAEHGKDIQHAAGSNPSSGFSTPKYVSNTVINKSGGSTVSSSGMTSAKSSVNVATLTDTSEYRTPASELFLTFTDPQRITAFTRSAPIVFEGAKPGGKFSLFGGNVSGEYIELAEPTSITQRWRLAQWPEGHFSTMRLRFEQNDVDAVTIMKVTWDGVPAGQEEVTKRNWSEYYVRSIKTTFGFGTVL